MADLTSRQEAQWYSVRDRPWAAADETLLPSGAKGRLLSRDSRTGSQTWQIQVPAGWGGSYHPSGLAEIFLISGSIEADGTEAGTGAFLALPPEAGGADLTSGGGAELVLFLNPQLGRETCYPDGKLHIVRSQDLPWDVPGDGVAVKRLRLTGRSDSESPGGFLNLLNFLPGFVSDEVEFHNTWEEMFYLDGDFFMVERGNAGLLTYHANPGGALHGPFGSQYGSLMLHHALEPYETHFDHRPGGLAEVGRYLDGASYQAARPDTEVRERSSEQEDPVPAG